MGLENSNRSVSLRSWAEKATVKVHPWDRGSLYSQACSPTPLPILCAKVLSTGLIMDVDLQLPQVPEMPEKKPDFRGFIYMDCHGFAWISIRFI